MSDAVGHADAKGHAHAHTHHRELRHHFDTMGQQKEAAVIGMWVFLLTEILFFGGLFMAYMLYRVWYPAAWSEGSRELDIALGGFNTVVLGYAAYTFVVGGLAFWMPVYIDRYFQVNNGITIFGADAGDRPRRPGQGGVHDRRAGAPGTGHERHRRLRHPPRHQQRPQ